MNDDIGRKSNSTRYIHYYIYIATTTLKTWSVGVAIVDNVHTMLYSVYLQSANTITKTTTIKKILLSPNVRIYVSTHTLFIFHWTLSFVCALRIFFINYFFPFVCSIEITFECGVEKKIQKKIKMTQSTSISRATENCSAIETNIEVEILRMIYVGFG